MDINIIVAASNNHVIGVENKMPWHLNGDMKYFKSLTIGKCIVMGRKTFESLGSKALPNRVNIIISSNEIKSENIVVRSSIEAALAYCNRWQQTEVFIIGGDSIYGQFFTYKLHIINE